MQMRVSVLLFNLLILDKVRLAMSVSERKLSQQLTPIVDKIVESHFRCFEHIWRRQARVRIVDQLKGNSMVRSTGRPKKQ